LRDLANFVSEGQVDTDRFIDRETKLVLKDSKKRESYFTSICGHCHGNDGQRFRGIPPLGKIATTDPWLALHNILNGHPGETMPALRVFGVETVAQILAYVQTLPVESSISSVARGGRLYDNWYLEADRRVPEIRHPAYPADGPQADNPKMNWRCKECHGWDYKGNDGTYADGPHSTGIKGIRGMVGADPAKIIALLEDEDHGYLGRLEYRDFQDLANFVSEGQIDMDKVIDRATLAGKGNEKEHISHFDTICAACHGTDGRKIRTMVPLGRIAREDPWNALHKIMNGHPDEEMPALRVLLDMPVLVDLLTFAQSLPER
jgi:mono/diheme cytochrome c family protein